MDGSWRGIWGVLTLFAAFSTGIAEEPEFLVPSTNVEPEFCEGYFDDNNNYHIGFQCTSTEENPDATYCCGSPTNKYCCDDRPGDLDIGSLNVGTLVGAIVGVVALVAIGIILCCCCCCCPCCLCSRNRNHVGRPHRGRSRSAARLISREGIRATLMRVRRKRPAPPVPEGPRSRTSGSPTQQQPPPQSSYPPQSYPPNQQYPPHQQQYPLGQYPQYPHQDYPPNYPPNYPPQPYPHPVPRSVNQSYDPRCEPMVPSFSAPPPPYTATSSESEQHQQASPLQDKHSPAMMDDRPSPSYQPPVSPRPRPASKGQAPPLIDKQSSSAHDFPSVAYPPPSRRVAGPPSAPPPDEDYPRKM
ncbi:uncharacterized protein [Asterias amurensis]|uniref:uncharacterized protein n=1 Tax=Asterias amurensis TaxID=7602 RepID=UPI003AB58832